MDKKLAVFIVHGIGTEEQGFGKGMEENIKENFLKSLEHMGEDGRPGKEDALIFGEGLWADITQKGEDVLKERLFNDREVDMDWMKLRRFAVDYGGDVTSYSGDSSKPGSIYEQIHASVQKNIDALSDKTDPKENTLLTAVTHSLGTVVLSDYFYDTRAGRRYHARSRKGLIFSNFFTMGSPIALYANRFYDPDSSKQNDPFHKFQPHPAEDEFGIWVNLFDEDDVIGYPIRPVNQHCKNAVAADLNVNTGSFLSGWTPASHTAYWEDGDVGKIIAEKLAIDWLRVNGWDKKTKTQTRLVDYKGRYDMP